VAEISRDHGEQGPISDPFPLKARLLYKEALYKEGLPPRLNVGAKLAWARASVLRLSWKDIAKLRLASTLHETFCEHLSGAGLSTRRLASCCGPT
jgi:hypothetical protein